MDQAKNDLKEMYDATAETYDKSYATSTGKYFMLRKIDTAGILGRFNGHILEVGCANGPYSIQLTKMGYKITGLDLSPKSIEFAKQWAAREGLNTNFVNGDAEALPFSDNYFDSVISFSALRYLENPQKAINEIFRVLKPGGTAVIDFPNAFSPWFTLIKPMLYKSHIHDHQYRTWQIVEFMHKAGFENIQTRRILYTPKIIGSSRILAIFKVFDKIGELPLLNNFASIIMCSGVKH